MFTIQKTTAVALGAFGAVTIMGTSNLANAEDTVTRNTVLIEEFTAEWCGPCVSGYHALVRAHARWGDAISELTYSISDRYENADSRKRRGEVGVSGVPSFLFHGTYFSAGTPSDGQIDNYIRSCQNITPKAQIIGRWVNAGAQEHALVGIKIQADQPLGAGYELRVVIHESNWRVFCSNGLTQYEYHVQQVFYEDLPVMNVGDQYTLMADYDLGGNQWIHNWDEVGITVYLHDRNASNGRNVGASWELGDVNLMDLNGDLSINNRDAQLFRNQIGLTSSHPNFKRAADVDGNGIVDLADRDAALDYIRNGGMR